jgi:hypothetical protein
MSDEKKPNRLTAHYATDEDYKRMNFYTIGTLYRTKDVIRSQATQPADAAQHAGQRARA